MFQLRYRTLVVCLAMMASSAMAATDPAAKPDKADALVVPAVPAKDAAAVEITDLHPFTSIAYIPVGADLSSIRFESVKAVQVATKRTSTPNQRYCGEGYQEPGGSMYCPYVQDGSPVPAYRITYSYSGPPAASDEYGNTHFTFSVSVRPEDLNPALRQTISARKIRRATAAEAFQHTTSRGLVPRTVIDDRNSALCDGNYSDGLWIHADRNCEDKVTYQTVTVPSDYIAITVDPASHGLE